MEEKIKDLWMHFPTDLTTNFMVSEHNLRPVVHLVRDAMMHINNKLVVKNKML